MNALLGACAALLASVSLLAAPARAELQAGRDYSLINPPVASQSTPGKIEVIEFFSYGCPHCNDFNPVIKAWEAKLPGDVAFRKVPVSFGRPPWERLAATYYALETIGEIDKLDAAVFRAVHQERNTFPSNEKILEWAVTKGVDKARMGDALNAFGMQSRIRRGDQEAAAAGIKGVPAIVVAGRYLVNNEAASNYADLTRLIGEVVALARKEAGAKK